MNNIEDYKITTQTLDNNALVSNKESLIDLLEYVLSVSFGHLDNLKDLAIESYDKMVKFEANKTAFIIGAFEKNELLGFVWAFEREYIGQSRIHINQIVINPEIRNRGIGGKLLEKLEKLAEDKGIYNIDLMVTSDNEPAIKFYKSKGFQSESILFKKSIKTEN